MRRVAMISAVGIAILGVSAGVALAAGGFDDAEKPITGVALTQASAAALASTGEGRVTETEVGDEDGYYEVEVMLADGRQVDVHLDKSFTVTSTDADADEPGDRAGANNS
jgi:hypothetical protein